MELLNSGISNKILEKIPSVVLDTIKKYPGSFIAGGYLRDLYAGLFVKDYVKKTPAKDIDVFFKDGPSFFSMKSYLERNYKLVSRTYDDEETFLSNRNSIITIMDGPDRHTFNLIRWPKLFNHPTEIETEFNYTINCIATDGYNVWVHENLLDALELGDLQLIKITDPVLHLHKMQKYVSYGFRMDYQQVAVLLMKLKLGDYEVLDR